MMVSKTAEAHGGSEIHVHGELPFFIGHRVEPPTMGDSSAMNNTVQLLAIHLLCKCVLERVLTQVKLEKPKLFVFNQGCVRLVDVHPENIIRVQECMRDRFPKSRGASQTTTVRCMGLPNANRT